MDPVVESAIVSGVFGCAIWWGTTRNNRRAQAATDSLAGRQLALDGKQVDLSVLTESIDVLRADVAALRADLQHEQEQRRLSNAYARTLAQVLRDHAMPVPQPPDGLDLA